MMLQMTVPKNGMHLRRSCSRQAVRRKFWISSAQLSATYGKGFELLQRMGFTAGSQGLRADSLAAPLRAHNQGRSRMGVQGEEEGSSPPFVAAPNVAQGASRPMNELLMEVLASMQENGDAE